MKKFLPYLLVAICGLSGLSSCGSTPAPTQSGDSANLSANGETTNLETLLTKKIEVDVPATLMGSWTVKGYSATDTEFDAATSTVVFGANGSLASWSAKPLYDFPEGTFTSVALGGDNGCVEIVTASDHAGEPIHYTPNDVVGMLNATLSYAVMEVPQANPMLKIQIMGKGIQSCCATVPGGCANSTMNPDRLFDGSYTYTYEVVAAIPMAIALKASKGYIVFTK